MRSSYDLGEHRPSAWLAPVLLVALYYAIAVLAAAWHVLLRRVLAPRIVRLARADPAPVGPDRAKETDPSRHGKLALLVGFLAVIVVAAPGSRYADLGDMPWTILVCRLGTWPISFGHTIAVMDPLLARARSARR